MDFKQVLADMLVYAHLTSTQVDACAKVLQHHGKLAVPPGDSNVTRFCRNVVDQRVQAYLHHLKDVVKDEEMLVISFDAGTVKAIRSHIVVINPLLRSPAVRCPGL